MSNTKLTLAEQELIQEGFLIAISSMYLTHILFVTLYAVILIVGTLTSFMFMERGFANKAYITNMITIMVLFIALFLHGVSTAFIGY